MAFKMISFLALVVLCALAEIHEFKASFVATNDPLIPGGVVKGTIVQIYDTEADVKKNTGMSMIKYTSPASLTEILSVSTSLRYRYCSDDSCETETTADLVQPFHYGAYGRDAVVVDGLHMRNRTTSANYQIKAILFQDDGTPVKAFFHNGKVWALSDVSTTLSDAEKNFHVPASCPQPKCNAVMDVAIVMDMSSSIDTENNQEVCEYSTESCSGCTKEEYCAEPIDTYECTWKDKCDITNVTCYGNKCHQKCENKSKSSYSWFNHNYCTLKSSECNVAVGTRYKKCTKTSEWAMLKDFVVQTIQLFNVGEQAIQVGVVAFTKDATIIHTLSGEKQSLVSTVSSLPREGRNTCQGVGIKAAFEQIFAGMSSERKKLNAPKVVITLTDGEESSSSTCSITSTNAMATYGDRATFISLGIGTSNLNDVLKKIATNTDLSMLVSSFAGLNEKLNDLVAMTCNEIEPINLCGAACKGFCGCNRECICPDCDVPDACHTGVCKTGNDGCAISEVKCESPCATQECRIKGDGTAECVDLEVTEPAQYKNDHCVEASCTKEQGWIPVDVQCEEKECHRTIRNSTNPDCCEYEDRCTPRECYDVECMDDSCVYTNKNIDDELQCVKQTCTTVNGEDVVTAADTYPCPQKPCMEAVCTPGVGCQYRDLCVTDDVCLQASCAGDACAYIRTCNWCTVDPANAASCKGDHVCYTYWCDESVAMTTGSKSDFCESAFIGVEECREKLCAESNKPTEEPADCMEWVCNPDPDKLGVAHGWYQRHIQGCDACQAHPCTDADVDVAAGVCEEYVCTVKNPSAADYSAGNRGCEVVAKKDNSCKGTNPCLIYDCALDECTQEKRTVAADVDVDALFPEGGEYDPCYNYKCEAVNTESYVWKKDGKKEGCNWCTLMNGDKTNGESCEAEEADPCFEKKCTATDSFSGSCVPVFVGEQECKALVCTAAAKEEAGVLGSCMLWECKYDETSATNKVTGWTQVLDTTCDACKAHPCPAKDTLVDGQPCMQYTGVCTVVNNGQYEKEDRECETTSMVEGKCKGNNPCIIYGCTDNQCTETARRIEDADATVIEGTYVDPCFEYTCQADATQANGFIWKKASNPKFANCDGCTYNNNAAQCDNAFTENELGECDLPECVPLSEPVDEKWYRCDKYTMSENECKDAHCPLSGKPKLQNPCLEVKCVTEDSKGWVTEMKQGCNLCDYVQYDGTLTKCQRVVCSLKDGVAYDVNRLYTADDFQWNGPIEATAVGERCYGRDACELGGCDLNGDCFYTGVSYDGEDKDDKCLEFTCHPSNDGGATWTSTRHCNWCTVDPANAESCDEGHVCYTYGCNENVEKTAGDRTEFCTKEFIGAAECSAKICAANKKPTQKPDPCMEWACNGDEESTENNGELGWYQKYKDGCDACQAFPCSEENGDEKLKVCYEYSCTVDNAGKFEKTDRTCVQLEKKDNSCKGNDPCTIYDCALDECTETARTLTVEDKENNALFPEGGQYDRCFNYVCEASGTSYVWKKDGDRIDGCNWCSFNSCPEHAHPCKRHVCSSTDTFERNCDTVETYITGGACEALACPGGCTSDDPCRTPVCDIENQECTTVWKEGCDACKGTPCKTDDLCMDVTCMLTAAGMEGAAERTGKEAGRVCTFTPKTDENGSCYSSDKCKESTCNPNTGFCTYTPTQPTAEQLAEIEGNKCKFYTCQADGSFEPSEVQCSSADPCIESTCDTADGLCKERPRCTRKDKCTDRVCVVDGNGGATCEEVATNCFLNHCVSGVCNMDTGACDYTPIPIEQDEDCMTYSCDPSAANAEDAIIATPVVCDDTPCFKAYCKNNQCHLEDESICEPQADMCHDALCSSGECYLVTKKSEITLTEEESACFRTVCNVEKDPLWSKEIIPEAFLDSCGDCYQNFRQYYSGSHGNVKCLAGMTVAEFSATMGGVAIAGIVAAVLIGAAVVAVSGFYGTKELLRLAGVGADNGMHNNPLYEEDGVAMENPMFDERN